MNGLLTLYTDGASRGNPGPASYGVVAVDASGKTVQERHEYLGIQTNNFAEYRALIAGLEVAESLGAKSVMVKTDSKLVVEQILGNFRVKDSNLRVLWSEALASAKKFTHFSIQHVARSSCEGNKRADHLANIALDTAGK